MSNQDRFSLLRTVLHALGLSAEAIDDIIDRILDFLSDKEAKPSQPAHFPYRVRDDFLSPAEQSFFLILKKAVDDWALVCPKVSLGDLFYARSSNPREHRTYTNKIDRKHIDFLLCDPLTAKPILGIELDDRSHQRADRQERDEFVEEVFDAAQLPLARIPVQRAYNVAELTAMLRQKAGREPASPPNEPAAAAASPAASAATPPKCPKCGSTMVLRTARTGASQGEQFWGCSNFPKCRGIVKYGA